MGRTNNEHPTSRGTGQRKKNTATLSKLERDIRAYELTLQGCSVRGVCEELGIKSTDTAHNAIQRGKAHVIEHGIDVEERRIEIDKLFKETLGMLAKTIRHQVEHGQEEFYVDENGRKSMRRRVGVDPRIAGELSRSLNRWAEFCGLLERAPEAAAGEVSTNVVFINPTADGAAWDQQAVDVTPGIEGDTSSLPPGERGQPAKTSVEARAVDVSATDLAQNQAQNASDQGELL